MLKVSRETILWAVGRFFVPGDTSRLLWLGRISQSVPANFLEADFRPALLKVRPGSSFCATACAPPTALAARLKRFLDRSIRKLST